MNSIWVAMVFVFQPLAWSYTKSDQAALDKRLPEFVFSKDEGVEFGFNKLCRQADIPCGIEYSFETAEHPVSLKKRGHYVGAEAKTLLDALIAQNPRYRWTINAGVINLVPKAREGDKKRHDSPLDRVVESMELTEVALDIAATRICQSAGILIHSAAIDSIGGSPIVYRKVTVDLRKVTLREALNRLVKTDGHSSWLFSQQRKHMSHEYPDSLTILQWSGMSADAGKP
ncbi:MAG: hypothetical protein NTY77_04715 [Elusimicrobia bacterium]|nr:hypothetical protein [Elusimicrobiota bacterium]